MTVLPARDDRERDAARGGVRRRLVLAATVVLAALLAWRIVATTRLQDRPTSVAALLNGPNATGPAQAWNPSAAEARARLLLAVEPLSSDAYTVLGLAAERAGRDDAAARLMDIAAAWWPRDLVAQTWLLGRDLRLGDARGAMVRLDAVARTRPETLEALTDAIVPALQDRAVAAALADALEQDPPWRIRFLDIAVRLWRAPDSLIGLFERLQAKPPGLRAAELRPYLTKLLVTGRVEQAYRAWLRSLPAARLADLTYLYNGHFQYPVTGMPFDWTFPAVAGAIVTVSAEGDHRILTVGFLGGRVTSAPVVHDLVLAPGSYRLTGRVRTDRLRAERGAQWRIVCQDAPDAALSASEPFVGSTAWRDFAVEFTVPDTGCGVQTLSLVIEARTEVERLASGTASFSGLAIEARDDDLR